MLVLKTSTRTLVAAFILLGSMIWAPDASAALKVASWNIQFFGSKKAQNAEVMMAIVDTVKQYDLVLVQEIRDVNDASATALLNQLNAATGNAYSMIVSKRLGRTNSKEQYAFLYRKSALMVVDSFQYPDADDLFEREPLVVRFRAPKASVKDFFVIQIHTNPSAAPQEVGALVKVYDEAVKRLKIKDGVIMGSMNAGCSYFAKKHWATNPLRTAPRFSWLIGDDADTTVGKANCAYDRAVVAGDKMRAKAAQGRPVYYDEALKLDMNATRLVSDHYPIEFVIK